MRGTLITPTTVMAGLDPAIHAIAGQRTRRCNHARLPVTAWIAGSSPAMTKGERGRAEGG